MSIIVYISICLYDSDFNEYSELVLAASRQNPCLLYFCVYNTWWRVEQLFDQKYIKSSRGIWRFWSILPVRSTRSAKYPVMSFRKEMKA